MNQITATAIQTTPVDVPSGLNWYLSTPKIFISEVLVTDRDKRMLYYNINLFLQQ